MGLIQLAIFTICVSNIIRAENHVSDSTNIVITVLSEPEGFNAARAQKLRDDILGQAADLENVKSFENFYTPYAIPQMIIMNTWLSALAQVSVEVVLTHRLNLNSSWTVGPLLPHLAYDLGKSDWYFICEVNTVVRLHLLMKLLNRFNSSQDIWMGHALYDHEPTIIHHFSEHTKKFKYPNTASGFVISASLVTRLAHRVTRGEKPEGEFSIDAAYEFATFLWDNGKGNRMIHAPELCVVSGDDCATYPQHFHPCSKSVPIENIYIAVKTCSKFHMERLSIIKKTWVKYAVNIGFYSDKSDDSLPEAIITFNTERGHCAKTFSILKHFSVISSKQKLDWLVITDDDTILSLGRLLRLLTCYNPLNSVALGERYGFRLWENNGYNYLTGGAGLVLSASVVEKLIEPGFCSCPSPSTPDDMFLFGVCLKRAGLQPTHSPFFHQARPDDYPREYLASQEPVSFHKFWLIDPEQVYEEWFAEADSMLSRPVQHNEL